MGARVYWRFLWTVVIDWNVSKKFYVSVSARSLSLS